MSKGTVPNQLKRIAEQTGESPEVFIPRTIEEEGAIYRAAAKLDVAPNTLMNWLRNNGYEVVTEKRVVVRRIETANGALVHEL